MEFTFNSTLNDDVRICKYTLYENGNRYTVNTTGKGEYVKSIYYGNILLPSLVMPEIIVESNSINIELGKPAVPYLEKCSVYLSSVNWNEKNKIFEAIAGVRSNENVEMWLISPHKLNTLEINGKQMDWEEEVLNDKINRIKIEFKSEESNNNVIIKFE